MKKAFVEYKHDDVVLEAYVVTPDENKKLPTILLLHAWKGRDELMLKAAEEWANKGYVGIALDTYGKGKLGGTKEENAALMKPFMDDRAFLAKRLFAGVEMAKKLPSVNANKMLALGFCFGGLCALDLWRHGAELSGVISVHGLLGAPEVNPKKYRIETKVLALGGYNDPIVTPDQVQAFEKELDHSKADWQLVTYGNTVHAFTNPEANDKAFGTVYNPVAAKRASQAIDLFVGECFQ